MFDRDGICPDIQVPTDVKDRPGQLIGMADTSPRQTSMRVINVVLHRCEVDVTSSRNMMGEVLAQQVALEIYAPIHSKAVNMQQILGGRESLGHPSVTLDWCIDFLASCTCSKLCVDLGASPDLRKKPLKVSFRYQRSQKTHNIELERLAVNLSSAI
ncbi:hypothetical protein UY3_06958 [Chelonia mydas]|uniref:Uncharacterized protein n=1 Tax=Chelonia mydas TaxID=8469 RepID=M7C5U2_CHEMY|nr:hypothetical protein UY3_06958 [Chelonia mydas]